MQKSLIVSNKVRKSFMCAMCGKSFWYKPGLTSHMKRVHNYSCQQCKAVQSHILLSELKEHQFRSHRASEQLSKGPQKDFTCTVCGKKFSTANNLHVHEILKHNKGDPRYKCPECGKGFFNKLKKEAVFKSNNSLAGPTTSIKRMESQESDQLGQGNHISIDNNDSCLIRLVNEAVSTNDKTGPPTSIKRTDSQESEQLGTGSQESELETQSIEIIEKPGDCYIDRIGAVNENPVCSCKCKDNDNSVILLDKEFHKPKLVEPDKDKSNRTAYMTATVTVNVSDLVNEKESGIQPVGLTLRLNNISRELKHLTGVIENDYKGKSFIRKRKYQSDSEKAVCGKKKQNRTKKIDNSEKKSPLVMIPKVVERERRTANNFNRIIRSILMRKKKYYNDLSQRNNAKNLYINPDVKEMSRDEDETLSGENFSAEKDVSTELCIENKAQEFETEKEHEEVCEEDIFVDNKNYDKKYEKLNYYGFKTYQPNSKKPFNQNKTKGIDKPEKSPLVLRPKEAEHNKHKVNFATSATDEVSLLFNRKDSGIQTVSLCTSLNKKCLNDSTDKSQKEDNVRQDGNKPTSINSEGKKVRKNITVFTKTLDSLLSVCLIHSFLWPIPKLCKCKACFNLNVELFCLSFVLWEEECTFSFLLDSNFLKHLLHLNDPFDFLTKFLLLLIFSLSSLSRSLHKFKVDKNLS